MTVNPRSVRFRTTVGAALALAALLALAGLLVDWFVGREVRESFDRTLAEQARDRAALLDAGAPAPGLVTAVGEEAVVVVFGPDGSVLASEGAVDPSALYDQPVGISTGTFAITEHRDDVEEREVKREELRVAVAESTDGSRVAVASESESTRRTTSAVRTTLVVGVPVLAVVAGAIAWLVTGRALAPVHRMHTDLRSIGHGPSTVDRVTDPGSDDEIAELAARMNDLLDRLDAQSAARRRFVADASHELKSPIANAHAILDTADAADDQAVRDRVTVELSRLQAIVDDLLFLARTDERSAVEMSSFDLDDVVFDEAERVAHRSAKEIDASGVVPAPALADRSEVARAIRNLLENAERHASQRVAVSIRVRNGSHEVRVDDDGPGIPIGQREHVFERFARLGSDRARSDGGTGLGLSIVASIAERNGGSVAISDSPLGGARFTLRVPARS